MHRRDGRHGRACRGTGEDGRFRTWLALLVVLALTAGVVATYRYDLADRWFPRDPAGPVDPRPSRRPRGWTCRRSPTPAPLAAPLGVEDPIDKAAVRAALAPYLRDDDLGDHVLAAVSGLSTAGRRTPSAGVRRCPRRPRSCSTALATLATIDPATTFATRVVRRGPADRPGRRRRPAPGERAAGCRPQGRRARGLARLARDLTTLARQSAEALLAAGVTSVRVRYDDSLFTGPAVNPSLARLLPARRGWSPRSRPCGPTRAGPRRGPAGSRTRREPLAEIFAREPWRRPGSRSPADRLPRPPTRRPSRSPRSAPRPSPSLVEHALLVSDNEADRGADAAPRAGDRSRRQARPGTRAVLASAGPARRTRPSGCGSATAAACRART